MGISVEPPPMAPQASLMADQSPEVLFNIFREVDALGSETMQQLRLVCRDFAPAASSPPAAALKRVTVTPWLLSLAAHTPSQLPRRPFPHAQARAEDPAPTETSSHHDTKNSIKNISYETRRQLLKLIRSCGRHMTIVGEPREYEVAQFLATFSSVQSICWRQSPGSSLGPAGDVVTRDGVTFGIPGLQGLALGRLFGPEKKLSLEGLPLAGLADRLSQFMDVGERKAFHLGPGSATGLTKLSFSPLASGQTPVTSEDMAALKTMMRDAPHFDTLVICGHDGKEHNGYAGGPLALIAPDDLPATPAFYLPAFDFATERAGRDDGNDADRLPALEHLHLWRYDWRKHSQRDVARLWNLSRLRTLVYDGAPLRRFLGTLNFGDLAHVETLCLDDAEWAVQQHQGRQSALLVGLLLQHHVRTLKHLRLTRFYTDNLPMTALRRHAATLETLVLRHPFGMGRGVDAAVPTLTPLALMALWQKGRDTSGHEDDMANVRLTTTKELEALRALGEVDMEAAQDAVHGPAPPTRAAEYGGECGGGPGDPPFSRLRTLELDLDDRMLDHDQEAEFLVHLTRLPRLRSLRLAVPSILHSLVCVPKFDVDLHAAMPRILFLLGQRNQRIWEAAARREEAQQRGEATGGHGQHDDMGPLDRVVFYIGGFLPRGDKDGQAAAAAAANNTHSSGSDAFATPPLRTVPGPVPATPPPAAMMSTLGSMPPPFSEFRAPTGDLHVSAGMGEALALRALGLRADRCIVVERRQQPEDADGTKLAYDFFEEVYEEEAETETETGTGIPRRPYVRYRLPYSIDFALPQEMAPPRWDMLGVPMWAAPAPATAGGETGVVGVGASS